MKNLVCVFALFIFISPLFQCSEEQPPKPICSVGELPSTPLEKYFNCTDTRFSTKINVSNTYKIIQSQAELKQYVTSACDFNIDFTNFDLVIGNKQLTSGNHSISYLYSTQDCITKTLKVTFKQDETSLAPNITFHRLIPKLSISEKLQVEIVIN